MCKICTNHSGAMKGRLLVQGRSNLRTGEIESSYRETRIPRRGDRSRLREELRECVSDVEMFAGCLRRMGSKRCLQ